jgi:hypothetical protein
MNTVRTPIVLPPALAPLVVEQRWVVWKWVKGKNGKLTKPPFQGRAPHKYASSTDSGTWCDFDTAMRAYCENKAEGVGFALAIGGVGAFDIDHCRDSASGDIHPWATALVNRCGSYAEVTPSGEGIRIIGTVAGTPLHRKFPVAGANGMSIEIYRNAERYITISGAQIGEAHELVNIDGEIDRVAAKLDGGSKQKEADTESRSSSQHNLDFLIKNGCGDDFGGDRSRAVWYVINQLLKQGCSGDEVVAVLLDQGNGISAHVYDQSRPEEYAGRQVDKALKKQTEETNVDAEIKRLAQLSPVEFERERKGAAERLGIRASILEKLVKAERPDDDSKQGRAISFPEPEAWAEPVNGEALLDSIAQAIRHYVVLPDHARDAAALWIVHSYLIDCFLVSPRLAICSATKQCGKTTLLDVLGRLVLKPLPTANVTASAIFRVVEAYRPSLLVDEADTFLRDNDELRGVINSGHRHGGSVLRAVGDDYEPRAFSTYAACAIALIGKLPDTLHDRSVVIDLKRRLPSETIHAFRSDRVEHLDVLARQAARWCQDHADEVANADPAMPEGIYNREADNWRPLLAIADAAGGHWSECARKALEQSHAVAEDDSRLTLLLGDIKAEFTARDIDRLTSASLVAALVEIEGRPWAEYRRGKPLTQNQLARALKPIGIAPEVIREGSSTPRGYMFGQFGDAFDRYLAPEGVSTRNSETNVDKPNTSEPFQTATQESDVALPECEKSNNDGPSCGVAVEKEEASQSEQWPLVCEHCGAPEQPGNPVQSCSVEGDEHLLHAGCQTEWMGDDLSIPPFLRRQ